jgi:hypothetical protein
MCTDGPPKVEDTYSGASSCKQGGRNKIITGCVWRCFGRVAYRCTSCPHCSLWAQTPASLQHTTLGCCQRPSCGTWCKLGGSTWAQTSAGRCLSRQWALSTSAVAAVCPCRGTCLPMPVSAVYLGSWSTLMAQVQGAHHSVWADSTWEHTGGSAAGGTIRDTGTQRVWCWSVSFGGHLPFHVQMHTCIIHWTEASAECVNFTGDWSRAECCEHGERGVPCFKAAHQQHGQESRFFRGSFVLCSLGCCFLSQSHYVACVADLPVPFCMKSHVTVSCSLFLGYARGTGLYYSSCTKAFVG